MQPTADLRQAHKNDLQTADAPVTTYRHRHSKQAKNAALDTIRNKYVRYVCVCEKVHTY